MTPYFDDSPAAACSIVIIMIIAISRDPMIPIASYEIQ